MTKPELRLISWRRMMERTSSVSSSCSALSARAAQRDHLHPSTSSTSTCARNAGSQRADGWDRHTGALLANRSMTRPTSFSPRSRISSTALPEAQREPAARSRSAAPPMPRSRCRPTARTGCPAAGRAPPPRPGRHLDALAGRHRDQVSTERKIGAGGNARLPRRPAACWSR